MKQWTALVRNGIRFGLRSHQQEAEGLHNLMKPEVPYLHAEEVMHFTVGPFLFGATKASIAKIFQTWEWSAKPVQPRNRTSDNKGMLWEVHASHRPRFEVYQLKHADVLVSEVAKKQAPKTQQVDVQGSARTIATLVKHEQRAEEDPWAKYDPWQTGQASRPAKQTKHLAPTPQIDVEVIAAQVQKKVTQQIMQQSGTGDDVNMEMNLKVNQLEERLATLEDSVQRNQHQQQQQNVSMMHTIGQVQHQVEQQGASLTQHFDRKFQEQMVQIEALLARSNGQE